MLKKKKLNTKKNNNYYFHGSVTMKHAYTLAGLCHGYVIAWLLATLWKSSLYHETQTEHNVHCRNVICPTSSDK